MVIKKSDFVPTLSLSDARHALLALGQVLPEVLGEIKTQYSNTDFSHTSFRRRFFDQCEFSNCDFIRSVGTGARWSGCSFLGCTFDGADMEFADFSNAKFTSASDGKSVAILGSGFNATIMRGTKFENFRVVGSSFAQSDFTGATLINCEVMDGTYEGCLFNNAYLNNVSFSNANVEFIDFTGARFEKTYLPLMQFPYTFGLTIQQLQEGDVLISPSDKGEPLTFSEFTNHIPALIAYYAGNQEYFALANLARLYGKKGEFLEYLVSGIQLSASMGNFRELKYLCRLASIAQYQNMGVSRGILKKLHDRLLHLVSTANDPGITQQYALHDGLIRSYLLGNNIHDITLSFVTTTDNFIEAQRYVVYILSALKKAFALLDIDISFQEADIATYSNAQVYLKTSALSIDFPFKIRLKLKKEYEVCHEAVTQTASSPWHSQAITTVIIGVVSLIISGSILTLNVLDRLDDYTELRRRINQQEHQLMQIHESIKDMVEPNTLTFIQGSTHIASLRNGKIEFLSKPNIQNTISLK